MQFDPENEIVQLCIMGMQAEGEGYITKAHSLFQEAWDKASNDFEAFTSAHYLARNQADDISKLEWNLLALHHAEALNKDAVNEYLPSLYLNVAKSYETLNQLNDARHHYQAAGKFAAYLPAGQYAEVIRYGISEGIKRTTNITPNISTLDSLISTWCKQEQLKPLSIILPAYVGNLGTEVDQQRLLSALHFLSATKSLDEEQQSLLDQIINNYQISN